MLQNALIRAWGFAAFFWLLVAGPAHAAPITAQEILESIKARARFSASNNAPACEFRKVMTVEELGKDGVSFKTNEMIYKVVQARGSAQGKLLSTNGKIAPEKQSGRDRQKSKHGKGKASDSDDDDDLGNPWLNDELMGRFDFALQAEKELGGRKVWILSFEPKLEDLPRNNFMDRFLNRLHGEIWVDQAESEVSFLEISLINQVKVWGGILGQLEEMAFKIHRQSVAGGVWVQSSSEGMFVARKLLSTMRFRTREETSGYRLIDQ